LIWRNLAKRDAHLWSARRPEVVADLRGGNTAKLHNLPN
jgi:hypothetical protein